MGQTRQEELVNYFLENGTSDQKFIEDLFIKLSPYSRKDSEWKKNINKREPVKIEKKKTARQSRIEILQETLDKLNKELQTVEDEEKALKKYRIVGMKVHHKVFGDGEIKEFKEKRISIDFNGVPKLMTMPDAFYKGFITSEHDDFVEDLKKRIELKRRKKKLLVDLESVKQELDSSII